MNWTHSRAAGRQYTGVSSRSHSRPSSPSSFPFLRHPSRPNTPTRLDIDIPARLAKIQNSLDSEGSEIPIDIKEPSRPGTPEDTRSEYSRSEYSFSPPQLSSLTLHGRTQSLSTHSSTEFVKHSADSKGQSPSGSGAQIGAHQSRESLRPAGSMTSRSTQAPPRPSFMFPKFPEPSIPGISTQASTMNAGNSPSRPGTPPVRPMNSDQVSRYLKNGDV